MYWMKMNIELIRVYLFMWKEYADSYRDSARLGYPKKAMGFSSGGSVSSFDDLSDQEDSRIVHAMEAIIYGLPDRQKNAILVITGQLPAVINSNRLTDEEILEMAYRGVWNGMVKRNIV
jgi:hypothetical protein